MAEMEVWTERIKTDFGSRISEEKIASILADDTDNLIEKVLKLKEITENEILPLIPRDTTEKECAYCPRYDGYRLN